MVGLDYDLSKKSILIRSYTSAIDLPNSAVSTHLGESTLFQGDDNYLLYTSQDHNFGISIYEADNNHSGKQYINDRYQVVLMNFDKALVDMYLICVPIW